VSAPFVAEMVRQQLYDQYGERAYTSGLSVYTTVSANLQKSANKALWHALHNYNERHGYKTSSKIEVASKTKFASLPVIGDTYPAAIVNISTRKATAKLQDGTEIELYWHNSRNSTVLRKNVQAGDYVRVRQLKNDRWVLTQAPKVEGAFVAVNPQDGAIMALVGGFDFNRNKYNRVTQSKRQPGSGFKPVIYTAALEHGYTPASMINDAPLVIRDAGNGEDWRPENYSKRFYGMTSLRKALTYSRNIVSIRLLKEMGIDVGIKTGLRFGFTKEQLPRGLSLALGSGHATPLQMARFFSTFANGGFLITPYYIDHIKSHDGKMVFKAQPKLPCPNCSAKQKPKPNQAPRVIAPDINFLMNSMLRDVVQKGTATDARVLGRSDLAGKTGTTNDQRDAWFNGYTSTVAATAWVGFDNFTPLGKLETGGVAALPMWIEFMRTALHGSPISRLAAPKGVSQKGGDYYHSNYSEKLSPKASEMELVEERVSKPVRKKRRKSSSSHSSETRSKKAVVVEEAASVPATSRRSEASASNRSAASPRRSKPVAKPAVESLF
jgi:penicillin-binding protein 1A